MIRNGGLVRRLRHLRQRMLQPRRKLLAVLLSQPGVVANVFDFRAIAVVAWTEILLLISEPAARVAVTTRISQRSTQHGSGIETPTYHIQLAFFCARSRVHERVLRTLRSKRP